MATYLDGILAFVRREVKQRKLATDRAVLEARAAYHAPRGFAAALRHAAATRPAVIAELKKASPSRGLIRPEFEPATLASVLAAAGAAALSVLTEEQYFQGSLENLRQASAATSIPCLRKDFIVDEWQILEARAACADAILLIAAALSDAELRQFTAFAHSIGLDVLCEVHDKAEANRVRDLGCDAVGVNNRNLQTFAVRLETSLDLVEHLPADCVLVAESGIQNAADLVRLRAAGFHAFLIGESLMRQPEPGAALSDLLHGAARSSAEAVPCG